MAYLSLSRRDLNVLEKIKDPESDPSAAPLIDPSLPKDPHITDPAVYVSVSSAEQHIVRCMQSLELQLAGLQQTPAGSNPIDEYRASLARLGALITEHPNYASAHNNRAQAVRRLYGDAILLPSSDAGRSVSSAAALIRDAPNNEQVAMARLALSDLDAAIALLAPTPPTTPLSPQAARTLAMAHTQRAALYHQTAKVLAAAAEAEAVAPARDDAAAAALAERFGGIDGRREAAWSRLDFEEAASRDFAAGGWYGSEVARGLAVATNPTAKLCGQMVREAMRKEYGPEYAA